MQKETSNQDIVAGVRTETLKQKTGRTWAEWFVIIGKFGGKEMVHKDIARHLYAELRVPSWWSQMVTVGYEQAVLGRKVHEQKRGYQVSASRTFISKPRALYALWVDPKTRQQLLDGAKVPIRSRKVAVVVRFAWPAGGSVEVRLFKKPNKKTQIVISHTGVPTQKLSKTMQNFWRASLVRLASISANAQ